MSVGQQNPTVLTAIEVDGDLDMGAYNLKTDDILESSNNVGVTVDGVLLKNSSPVVDYILEKTADNGVVVDGVTLKNGGLADRGILESYNYAKVASDNLRNSHDAAYYVTGARYTMIKTITLTNGIEGVIRVKHDMKTGSGGNGVSTRIYKNGAAIGRIESDITGGYETKTEDINVGTMAAGDTIEIWGGYDSAGTWTYVQNFRLYYDNKDFVAVAATNS